MIVGKCPVRISLAGGSTDMQAFVDEYGFGSVITFTADLHTYIMLRSDRIGLNGKDKKFVVNYMSREIEANPSNIKNDIARVCIEYFKPNPLTSWFNNDFYSAGSGLAASSAYLNSIIAAMASHKNISMSQMEIAKLSHDLERKFNPLTGYQDPYGCAIGGFKKLEFFPDGRVLSLGYDQSIFENIDLYLVPTGISRSSTSVLKTIDPRKCLPLLDVVSEMDSAIKNQDRKTFLNMIKEGWKIKKTTSSLIAQNAKIIELDNLISKSPFVLAHRLLGAGNGGYFLLFSDSRYNDLKTMDFLDSINALKISIDTVGVTVS